MVHVSSVVLGPLLASTSQCSCIIDTDNRLRSHILNANSGEFETHQLNQHLRQISQNVVLSSTSGYIHWFIIAILLGVAPCCFRRLWHSQSQQNVTIRKRQWSSAACAVLAAFMLTPPLHVLGAPSVRGFFMFAPRPC
jgi:hypothetical protein